MSAYDPMPTSARIEFRSAAAPCLLFLSFGSMGGTGQ
jgi:hypothetical protein